MAQNENRILLHACCGICSGYPISYLLENGFEPVVYFCNPNIDTLEEFNRRLEAQQTVCEHFGVKLIVEKYDHNSYLEEIKGLEAEPERGKRCEVCIRMRLKSAIKKAEELGIKQVTTSLVISPHKNFEKISEIGEDLSKEYLALNDLPPKYVPLNFRKQDGFLKTNAISKELNIYRQNYCGCEFAKNHLK